MKRLRHETKPGRAGNPPSRLARFGRDEEGSFVIFGLMIFILMLTVGGLGVDFMRYEAQRSRLQATLDRAVLAAASLDQPLAPQEVVLDYFDKAGLGNYITADDINVVETLTTRYVEANVDMEVHSTFLKFVGIDSLIAPGTGAAQESTSQTEISLVLDVSGSMGWSASSGGSKIGILRSAARQFVNIVLCDPADPSKTTGCTVPEGQVSVSIVPYSEQVVVGEDLLSLFNPTDEHSDSSCVTFASNDFHTTAITPTQQLQRTGHFDPWRSSSRTPRDFTCETDSWRIVTPVGSDINTLHARINALQAAGNTSIDLGMKWGAALLDPAAQPVVDDLIEAGTVAEIYDERPLAWTERGIEKVIVLMTDGVNTSQHYLYDDFREGPSGIFRNIQNNGSLGSAYSVYNPNTGLYYWDHTGEWEDHAYGTAGEYEDCDWHYSYWSGWKYYCETIDEGDGAQELDFTELWRVKTWDWYERFSWLDRPGSSHGSGTKNARLDDICDAAKDTGITVFSVGFEVTSSSATVMRNCASSPAHYFDVEGLDLTDAFAAIAREISKLRLVN